MGSGPAGANGDRYLIDARTDIGDLLEEARRDGEVTSFTFEPPSLSDLFREAVRS